MAKKDKKDKSSGEATAKADTSKEGKDKSAPAKAADDKVTVSGHIVINEDKHPDSRWYVVHTTSGHEQRVARTLQQRVESQSMEDRIFEILVPTRDTVVIRSGKKQTVKEKILPGYMLVRAILDDNTWLAIRTTPGVARFAGIGNKPTPLSKKEVENIQQFIAEPAKRFKTKFTKGEAVKITDGHFSGFLGTINELDQEKGKVKVLVSIFGRETPVELDFLQIAKV